MVTGDERRAWGLFADGEFAELTRLLDTGRLPAEIQHMLVHLASREEALLELHVPAQTRSVIRRALAMTFVSQNQHSAAALRLVQDATDDSTDATELKSLATAVKMVQTLAD